MADYCDDCDYKDTKMSQCVPNGCQKHLEVEICEGCDAGTLWERVPDENVITHQEHESFWGAPCSYAAVDGYICPECGHRNDF